MEAVFEVTLHPACSQHPSLRHLPLNCGGLCASRYCHTPLDPHSAGLCDSCTAPQRSPTHSCYVAYLLGSYIQVSNIASAHMQPHSCTYSTVQHGVPHPQAGSWIGVAHAREQTLSASGKTWVNTSNTASTSTVLSEPEGRAIHRKRSQTSIILSPSSHLFRFVQVCLLHICCSP